LALPPKISVVIPSFNGGHRIYNTLDAVLAQSFIPDEIIVVVDGSTDNTSDVLLSFKEKYGVRVIYQKNLGRAAARNRGAREAKGELLIFYDDDTRPEPNSITLHEELHQKYKNSICGGFPLEDESKMNTDFLKYRRHLSLKWTAKYKDGLNKLNDKNLFLTAANMSISKDNFLKLGGFNELLTDAEDYEFAVRAFENGINIYFDKSNIAWHDDFISCKSYIIRQRQYNHANGELKKHIPSKYHRTEIQESMIPWFKLIVYRLCGQPVVIRMIDNEKLKWLPRFFKYKIYDWVITYYGRINTRINL
jgi:GT2 family glycosyltransferase